MNTPWPYPLWIAHRGAGKLAPENTLAAFRMGAGFGFRAFECDAKLSRDGQAFLLHDDTLERTTSGHGSPVSADWADLARLDAGSWHSPPFAAEPLPRLTQIAAFCQANGCALNIEIKPCPGEEARTGAAVAREAARLWAGAVPPVRGVRRFRRRVPRPTAFLRGRPCGKRSGHAMASADYFPSRPKGALHREAK